MTDMVAAYSVTPQVLLSAHEVLQRAASVRAFRRSVVPVYVRPVYTPTPVVVPVPVVWPQIKFDGQCTHDRANDARDYTNYPLTLSVSISAIQRYICDYFSVGRRELIGQDRSVRICRPRQIAMWLSRKVTFKSYPEIGRKFGDRDHATVINAFDKVERLIAERDEEACRAIRAVARRMKLGELIG